MDKSSELKTAGKTLLIQEPEVTSGDICFYNEKTGDPILELKSSGDILLNGRLIENDKDVVDGLRKFLFPPDTCLGG